MSAEPLPRADAPAPEAAASEGKSTQAGPDFICIGMPRAGTGWLYDQLAHHPDFWMPPIKEIRYLAREEPKLKTAAHRLKRWDNRSLGKRRFRQKWDERDRLFLIDAKEIGGQPRELKKYAWLFRHKGSLLSGDISPVYTALPDEIVSAVGESLPGVKIVFFIRDPVARAWSRICMAHRDGDFDAALLEEPTRFREFLETSKLIRDRSHPTQVTERWRRCAPHVPFRHYLLDDIRDDPDAMRADVLQFLGGDPDKSSGKLTADHNRKANAPMLPLEGAPLAVLVEFFRGELLACAAEYGGRATAWPTKYGVS